jgi:hypothetical protein
LPDDCQIAAPGIDQQELLWRRGMRELGRLGPWALSGLALVGGCAGSPVISNQAVYTRYSPVEFGVVAGRKDLRTVVHGDPFGMGEERFAEAAVAALNRYEPPPQPTNFTLEPGESANPSYRVVLMFDAPDISIIRLCQEPLPSAPPGAADDDALHVSAAFCLRQGELTAVKGRVAGVETVDDPGFHSLLGQIVIALFPRSDPTQDDDKMLLIGQR